MAFKVIHWDFQAPANPDMQMQQPKVEFHCAVLRNPKNNHIIGVGFTWKLRMQSVNGFQLLSYIGESHYIFSKVPSYQDVDWCIHDSHRDYMQEYDLRSQPIGLTFRIPLLTPGDINVQEVSDDLKDWKG